MNLEHRLKKAEAQAPRRGGQAEGFGDDAWLINGLRSVVLTHGELIGVPWDDQADHAGEAAAEVIESQGIDAARRWAFALIGELRAEREAIGISEPGDDEADPVRAGHSMVLGLARWAIRGEQTDLRPPPPLSAAAGAADDRLEAR